MKFEKSDYNQIQRTLTWIICIIMIAVPAGYFVSVWFNVWPEELSSMPFGQLVLFLGGLFLALFIIMMLMKPENRYFCVYDGIVLFSLTSLLLSTFFAQDVVLAIGGVGFNNEGAIILITYLLIMYAGSFIISDKCRRCIFGVLIVIALFEAFVGFMQSLVESNFFLGFSADLFKENEEVSFIRAFGTIVNPNPYGQLMGMITGLLFGVFFISTKAKFRVSYGVLIVIIVISLMISDTMGAIIGLLGAAFICSIYLLLFNRKDKNKLNYTVKTLLVVIVLCAVAIGITCILHKEWLSFALGRIGGSGDVIEAAVKDGNAEVVGAVGNGRIWAWSRGWEAYFTKYPVFGVGVSNIMLTNIVTQPLSVYIYYVIHNHYLDILYSQGIVGLVAYILLIAYILKGSFRLLKRDGLDGDKLRLGLVIAIITFLLIDITQWHIIYMTPYYYVLLGLAFPRRESKRLFSK